MTTMNSTPSKKPPFLTRSPLPQLLLGVVTMVSMAGLVVVTTSAVHAIDAADKVNKERYEPGHKFEYAHAPVDSAEAHEQRDYPMGPSTAVKGPNGRLTYVNRKMQGHVHHEDHPSRSAAEAKMWQDKRMWRQAGVWQGGKDWNNARSKNWQADHTHWPQRGGYGGAFITQPEYDKHYTVAHDFRIGDEPKMKNGYAHFDHEGDTFVIVDPYPENWNTKWHSSDDVYLDYNQGYYLHNRQHPGSPLAVMVLE
jgi:hypothetical protein